MRDLPATYVFADIAGFTALTEAHGDEEAVDLVDRFGAEVAEALPSYGALQVKSIGDAVMLRVPDAAAAVELGLHLAHQTLSGHGSPAVRVGMHHGAAICRNGDYFGSAVNLAARISALASKHEVLMSAYTATAAGAVAGMSYEARGHHDLKGVPDPVELVAAVRPGTRDDIRFAVDPVCHMRVDLDKAAGRLIYDGSPYLFCTRECAAAFGQRPERYVAAH
jgi:class 3 adenylate cyclase/YHS domain-containing protein